MKPEINNENKAKFFALYYDQPVAFTTSFVKGEDLRSILNNEEMKRFGEPAYLSLKPLSSVSDEDAIECGYDGLESFTINHQNPNFLDLYSADLLRSRGYALPWMGLSVDELEQAGWIRLI